MRNIFSAMAEGLVIHSGNGQVIDANPAAETILGLTRGQLLGKAPMDSHWQCIHADGSPFPFDDHPARQTIRTGVPIRNEIMGVRVPDSGLRWISVNSRPMFLGEGNTLPDGAMASFVDITELKQTSADLRLRTVSRRLMEVEETERRNINRELHDRVGQNLSALSLNLTLIRNGLAAVPVPSVSERLDAAQLLLEATVADVRDLMAELHPPGLDDYGLFAGLRMYVESLRRTTGMPVNLAGDDFAPPLHPSVAMAVFRIAQAAVANAAKHAGGAHVEVTLAATAETVSVTVADDGRGFDPARLRDGNARWGLRILRERADSVGASLLIDSSPGRGTRVIVAVPRTAT